MINYFDRYQSLRDIIAPHNNTYFFWFLDCFSINAASNGALDFSALSFNPEMKSNEKMKNHHAIDLTEDTLHDYLSFWLSSSSRQADELVSLH
jgi:hypothetical protein